MCRRFPLAAPGKMARKSSGQFDWNSGDFTEASLVVRVAVRVEQADGERFDPGGAEDGERGASGDFVER